MSIFSETPASNVIETTSQFRSQASRPALNEPPSIIQASIYLAHKQGEPPFSLLPGEPYSHSAPNNSTSHPPEASIHLAHSHTSFRTYTGRTTRLLPSESPHHNHKPAISPCSQSSHIPYKPNTSNKPTRSNSSQTAISHPALR
jgi:hypothetical protein